MTRNVWSKIDHWMRLIHLYTGLFLVPWMLVYAISAASLNHHPLLTKYMDIKPPVWKQIKQVDFVLPDGFPKDRAARATAILGYLGIDGPHIVPRVQRPGQLVVLRVKGGGNQRVTWLFRAKKLRVEQQQPFSTLRFINFMHFRAGYAQPYTSFRVWAAIVDLVAFCLVFWSVSGIYIWVRQRNRRLLGTVFFGGGIGTFVALVFLLLN